MPAHHAMSSIAAELKAEAERLGLAMAGIATPGATEHMGRYREWLAAGRHGEMGYLSRSDAIDRRGDLRLTMEGVRSVLVVADRYYLPDPEGVPDDHARAVVARYARGRDYHDVLKAKLDRLLAWLVRRVEGGVRGSAYVDTGPILERDLARRAGLGWFGKNTMLLHPKRGSYFFVGVLLLDVELPPDEPFEGERCGSCRACLDACPTGALLGYDEDGAPVMDARLCISYLTIELRGPIPRELRSSMANRVFGCDICQEVCPWNVKFARETAEPGYAPRPELDGPALVDLAERLLGMGEKEFLREFAASPVTRARRKGLLRNVCVALGNWGSEAAVPVLVRALADPQPLVRGHAAWALARIGSAEAVTSLERHRAIESDRWVSEETSAALGG